MNFNTILSGLIHTHPNSEVLSEVLLIPNAHKTPIDFVGSNDELFTQFILNLYAGKNPTDA